MRVPVSGDLDRTAHALLAGLIALHDAHDLDAFAEALPRVLGELVPFDTCLLVGDLGGPDPRAARSHSLALRTAGGGSTLRGVLLGRDRAFTPLEAALAAAAAPLLGAAADHVRLRQREREVVAAAPWSLLTPREQQVLGFVAEGRTDRDIAAILHIEARTVEKHVEHIRGKLGARSRAEAVARWARRGDPIAGTVLRAR